MNTNNYGQSLFEVLLAMLVIGVVIVALVALSTASIRNASFSKNKELSTRFSQDAIEWLRAERNGDWAAFATRAQNPTWCINANPPSWPALAGSCGTDEKISGSILTREVRFMVIDAFNIEAEVGVFWNDSQGFHEARTVTTFTDLREL